MTRDQLLTNFQLDLIMVKDPNGQRDGIRQNGRRTYQAAAWGFGLRMSCDSRDVDL